jgi:hypothetical protein
MEPQDLGPTAAMQIRSVPEKVREFYNELAYSEGKITLGELFTRIALGVTVVATTLDGRPVSAVQSAVAAARSPLNMETLLQAAQAYELLRRASDIPTPPRAAASLARAISAEVRRMRALPGPQLMLEGQTHE